MPRWEWWSSFCFYPNYLPPDWFRAGGAATRSIIGRSQWRSTLSAVARAAGLFGRVRARYIAAALAAAVAIWRWWDFHHQLVNRYLPGLYSLRARMCGWTPVARMSGRPGTGGTALAAAGAAAFHGGGVVAVCVCVRPHAGNYAETRLRLARVGAARDAGCRHGVASGRDREDSGNSAMKWVGRLSYSLYPWQQLFLVPGANWLLSRRRFLEFDSRFFIAGFAPEQFVTQSRL